jgi:hypothetical protein
MGYFDVLPKVKKVLEDKSFVLGRSGATVSIECQSEDDAAAMHEWIEWTVNSTIIQNTVIIDSGDHKIQEMPMDEYIKMIRKRREEVSG